MDMLNQGGESVVIGGIDGQCRLMYFLPNIFVSQWVFNGRRENRTIEEGYSKEGDVLKNTGNNLNTAGKRSEKKHRSTPEIVANRIIAMIESGELVASQKLPTQNDLAKQFGVGVSSIREAVNVLEVMGYIEVTHGKGMFVSKELPLNQLVISRLESDLAMASAFELFEIRELLETYVVRQASRKIERNGIRHIKGAFEKLKANVGEKKAFIDADIEFHVAIAEAVGYKATGAIIRMIHELIHKNFDLAATAKTTPYGGEAADTAEQVVAHIADGEELFAVRCMLSHLGLPKKAIVNLKHNTDG